MTAIVLLAPIFGMNSEMRELSERYTQRGFLVVAPDLFAHTHPGPLERTPEGRQLAMERKARLDVGRGIDDVLDAIASARSAAGPDGKVAVMGFCFGGRFAYYAAVRAYVNVAFGIHPTEIGISLDGSALRSPLSLHFGGADALVPMREVDAIAAAIGSDPNVETYVYPGAKHSFAIAGADGYDAQAAALVEERVLRRLEALP
jgi:carboxymethylenebutenolidase